MGISGLKLPHTKIISVLILFKTPKAAAVAAKPFPAATINEVRLMPIRRECSLSMRVD